MNMSCSMVKVFKNSNNQELFGRLVKTKFFCRLFDDEKNNSNIHVILILKQTVSREYLNY